MSKRIEASVFETACLRVIKQMNEDGEPVVVTKHGRPVAVVSPPQADAADNLAVGAMRGSVLGYDEPFGSVADPGDWSALG